MTRYTVALRHVSGAYAEVGMSRRTQAEGVKVRAERNEDVTALVVGRVGGPEVDR